MTFLHALVKTLNTYIPSLRIMPLGIYTDFIMLKWVTYTILIYIFGTVGSLWNNSWCLFQVSQLHHIYVV